MMTFFDSHLVDVVWIIKSQSRGLKTHPVPSFPAQLILLLAHFIMVDLGKSSHHISSQSNANGISCWFSQIAEHICVTFRELRNWNDLAQTVSRFLKVGSI